MNESCLTGVSYKCEEEPFHKKDGTVEWLQWEAHPWYEVPGKVGGLIMFKELVTGRKKTEKTLLKAKELAEETSRTKSNFVERMSHELRTPLTSILGYAQMLKIESGLTEDQYDQVDRIKVSGEYLLEIINDLLELSDFETGKIKFDGRKLDLYGLINEIVAGQSEKYAEHGNRHRIDIDEQADSGIYTDFQKVKTIAGNLINNAFKFTEDGEIAVTCKITSVEGSGRTGCSSSR